jgi:hypothetical protein
MGVIEPIKASRAERNKPGKGRKNRIATSLDTETEISLNRLAVSCDMPPATLVYLLLRFCLRDSGIVDVFQMDYNRNPAYWVIPVTSPNGARRLEVKR